MKRLIVLLLLVPAAFAADVRNVSELTFLEGWWQMTEGDSWTEEIWTAPKSDSVLGIAREIRNGKTVFYEILAIEQDESGPVMKLRHFNHALIGWEDKESPVLLPLVSLTANEAVFERADKQVRLTYRRTAPDTLYAMLERTKDGKKRTLEFTYKRAK